MSRLAWLIRSCIDEPQASTIWSSSHTWKAAKVDTMAARASYVNGRANIAIGVPSCLALQPAKHGGAQRQLACRRLSSLTCQSVGPHLDHGAGAWSSDGRVWFEGAGPGAQHGVSEPVIVEFETSNAMNSGNLDGKGDEQARHPPTVDGRRIKI